MTFSTFSVIFFLLFYHFPLAPPSVCIGATFFCSSWWFSHFPTADRPSTPRQRVHYTNTLRDYTSSSSTGDEGTSNSNYSVLVRFFTTFYFFLFFFTPLLSLLLILLPLYHQVTLISSVHEHWLADGSGAYLHLLLLGSPFIISMCHRKLPLQS